MTMQSVMRRWRDRSAALLGLGIVVLSGVAADTPAPVYSCSFAQGKWDSKDWSLIRRPDWNNEGKWTQGDGYIQNQTPADATEDQMMGARAPETYVSMVFNQKITGDAVVTATMEFTHRMAPSIVLASEIQDNSGGWKEYRQHFEVVLFDEGINVWRHRFEDGKPTWQKRAYCRFPLEKNVKYTLQVTKRGDELAVTVGDHTFAYMDESLPKEFFAGITGAEGVNRLYDFSVAR